MLNVYSGKLDVSTGIIFSIYTIGQMAGSLFAGQICDRYVAVPFAAT